MSFVKSKGFKYVKNLIIGVGAALVMVGALFKIQSWPPPMGIDLLTVGLVTEALLFLALGVLGPDKDYYWEKLYPGLDSYGGSLEGAGAGLTSGSINFNSEGMENKMDGMLSELKVMSQSMSSLKALQEVDFAGTGEQIKKMGNFYANLNDAMANINDSIEDTKRYKENLTALNQNLGSLNNVYGNMLNAMANPMGK